MSASKVHWMVSCRRAVVRESASYSELVQSWLDNLQSSMEVMRRWYKIEPAQYEAGRASVQHWFDVAKSVAAARDTLATLNAPDPAFYVRLWKGPLRVVTEQRQQPAPPGKEIVNPLKIESANGGIGPMNLNENAEMINFDAPFLMGDVVEFPLFKFLAACGLSDFGTAPSYTDKLSFNGKGSFLLGTSLKDASGNSPPASPLLHDNLVAMRFQLLLNCYLAAFYHDQPVFTPDEKRAIAKSDKKGTVYARGMLYAGELAIPREKQHWGVKNHEWCIEKKQKTPERIPTLSSLSKMSDDTVVTPGGTCSPTTLFLSNYMMRHFTEPYGGNSVYATLKQEYKGNAKPGQEPPRRAIEDSYQMTEAKDVAGLVPPVPEEDLRKALARLIEEVKRVLALVDGEQSFMRLALKEAEGWPEWATDVREKTRTAISKAADHPEKLIDTVNDSIKGGRTPAEEAAVMQRLHASLAKGAQNFGTELEKLTQSAEWSQFPKIGPAVDAKTVKAVREIDCPGGNCKSKHDFGKVESLRKALGSKQKNLEKKRDSREPLGDKVRARHVDLSNSEILSDVNSVSLDGHEWGVVRLYPHEKLLQSQTQPRAGFMAAYHPLDGKPWVESQEVLGMTKGQFFVFEEGDMLFEWTGTPVMTCNAGPFKWRPIVNNTFTVQVDDGRKSVAFGDGDKARTKPLQAIEKLRCQSPGDPLAANDPLALVHLTDPKAFEPIFIHPLEIAPFKDAATSRLSDPKP